MQVYIPPFLTRQNTSSRTNKTDPAANNGDQKYIQNQIIQLEGLFS